MIYSKILLIEDDTESVFLLSKLLERIGFIPGNITVCGSLSEINAITEDDFRLILVDLTLPDSAYNQTFERVIANFPHVPIIVLTGKEEKDLANITIGQGAQDYLVKGDFGQDVLHKAIHYAIERNALRQKLLTSQADYKRVFEESPNPMFVFDRNTYQILAVNIATIRQYGYSEQELLNMTMDDIQPAEDVQAFHNILNTLTSKYTDADIWTHINSDGALKQVQMYIHKTRFRNIDAIITIAINAEEKANPKEGLKNVTG